MKCPHCYEEISDKAKFCPKCGGKIEQEQKVFCVYCGAEMKKEAKFCPKCGRSALTETVLPEEVQVDVDEAEEKEEETVVNEEIIEENQGKKKKPMAIVAAVACLLIAVVAGIYISKFISGDGGQTVADAQTDVAEVTAVSETIGMDEAETEKKSNFQESMTPVSEISPSETQSDNNQKNQSEKNQAEKETKEQKERETEKQTEKQTESETEKSNGDKSGVVEFAGHTYQLFSADVSWSEAVKACEKLGGHLVTVTSKEEYEKIKELAEDSELMYIWMGARIGRGADNWGDDGCWITGEFWDYDLNWYPGEPSMQDTDGTLEDCLCFWHVWYGQDDIGWTFNDQRDDLLADFSVVSGKIGYICEFEDVSHTNDSKEVAENAGGTIYDYEGTYVGDDAKYSLIITAVDDTHADITVSPDWISFADAWTNVPYEDGRLVYTWDYKGNELYIDFNFSGNRIVISDDCNITYPETRSNTYFGRSFTKEQ